MQIVNDPIDPRSVRQALEELGFGISAVVAAEKGLLKDKAGKLSSLRRDAQAHAGAEEQRLAARLLEIGSDFKERASLAHAAAQARATKAQQAYHASKASLARRMQERKDSKIGRVQGDIMRKRQARQQELARAVAEHESFQKTLMEDRAARREIRKNLLSACRTVAPVLASWFDGRRKFDALEAAATPEQTRAAMLKAIDDARASSAEAVKKPLLRFFRFLPLTVLLLVVAVMHLWQGMRAGGGGVRALLPSLLIAEGVLLALWGAAFTSSAAVLKRAASSLATAKKLETAAEEQSAARLAALQEAIKHEESAEGRDLSETFRESGEEWRVLMAEGQRELEERFPRVSARLERLYQRRIAKIETAREAEITRVRMESEEHLRRFEAKQDGERSLIDAEADAQLEKLTKSWKTGVLPLHDKLVALNEKSSTAFPGWTREICETWEPPAAAPSAVRIGRIEVDAAKLAGGMPGHDGFDLTDGGNFAVPFSLAFPDQGSMLIETDGPDDGNATRVLHAAALRLLASHPPGRSSFLFIDPVWLGKDFAGLMHLADYEETLITNRIWTQSAHIEERLAEINEHIEKVIQMYLRDEFADINAYNEQAGTIAEKYRFLVIAGFPAAFSDTAAKRLRSIASSGARCGVHLLIQRDARQPAPDPALDDELRRICHRVVLKNGGFHLSEAPAGADTVVFDPPPAPHDSVELVHRIGRASVDSNRVQVPFSQIAPPPGEEWSLDTSEELRVPIGRTGAKKLQTLAIGKGTRQHVLVAGKTGSGKSTLFHVIITNLARWASPEQVEFYLVDFKKGVEFKCYAAKKLPHARVVAIESDREFALSVLQRVDGELKRRGELFRKAGSQDLPGYKRTAGAEPMPRTLLLIDEFQEFFTEDDAVAQEASLLLDRIVRQGRAFGIHVILGSQTLGGAYTLARATLGQMVIRVALQCNETDAHLIMDDDNPAPRLLTRPGEGIYNDQAGALAANSPFQIVWLPEDERDAVLDEVRARAGKEPRTPIVFEGNAPADIRDNVEIAALMRSKPISRPKKAHAWLGAPNSIKGPTEATFQRQSGSHLLVVGQSAERSLAQLSISLAALAMYYPAGEAEFVVLDPHASEAGDDDWFRRLAAVLPHRVRIGGPAEVAELMNSLAAEISARAATAGRDAPEVFVIIHDLQRFKALRPDDDFRFSLDDDAGAANPSKVFADLLSEGGPSGMHVIVSIDTWNNVSRWIPRKLLAEFEMRVLFQMSANDSANLIDSPAAGTLGLHRALFYNEHLGTLETFRPYALPAPAWIEEIAAKHADSPRA
jgi:energy-coupling factor transporter ATP-binding protein EcfA2